MVDDHERSPASLTTARLKEASSHFVPQSLPESEPLDKQPQRASSTNWRTIIIVVILAIIAIYWFRSTQQDSAQAAARENISGQMIVESSNYMVNRLLGGISDLRITVTNNFDYLVDIVKVTYIKADGNT